MSNASLIRAQTQALLQLVPLSLTGLVTCWQGGTAGPQLRQLPSDLLLGMFWVLNQEYVCNNMWRHQFIIRSPHCQLGAMRVTQGVLCQHETQFVFSGSTLTAWVPVCTCFPHFGFWFFSQQVVLLDFRDWWGAGGPVRNYFISSPPGWFATFLWSSKHHFLDHCASRFFHSFMQSNPYNKSIPRQSWRFPFPDQTVMKTPHLRLVHKILRHSMEK